MPERQTGRYLTTSTAGEPCLAFLPKALPPDPPLSIDQHLRKSLDEALLALGRLDSVTLLLPDPTIFLYTYIRKEAVLSSQIEGTQSSLSDLLRFESDSASGVPVEDVVEVSNYAAALIHGLTRVREGFPLSQRLMREIHGILLRHGRGAVKNPGEYRRSQNWIGGTRPGNAVFVPPPPEKILGCMSDLERFLHEDPGKAGVIAQIALAHVQFETIHPFLDGNGRLGRLLIPLFLCSRGVLEEPLLYLSLFFKTNRGRYYELLQSVRDDGVWEEWLNFFAEAVIHTANQAVSTARTLTAISEEDRRAIQEAKRTTSSTLEIHRALRQQPVASIKRLVDLSNLTTNTVSSSLELLIDLGLVEEVTGRKRNRLYSYRRYLAILNEGTERTQHP